MTELRSFTAEGRSFKTERSGYDRKQGLPSMDGLRPRAAPVLRLGPNPGGLPQILPRSPPIYALFTEILRYNRSIPMPYSPVAAKNGLSYRSGATLQIHLSRWPHLAQKLRLNKAVFSPSDGLFMAA
jgi:hypothetical protein